LASTETGRIYTDADQKWAEFGTITAVCAGNLGELWLALRKRPPRSLDALRKRLIDKEASDNDRGHEVLAYDRRLDCLVALDDTGEAIILDRYDTIGCGGAFALGVLDAARRESTLAGAARLVQRAIGIACKRNAFCGGPVQTIVAPVR
jgi:hypothetical protein